MLTLYNYRPMIARRPRPSFTMEGPVYSLPVDVLAREDEFVLTAALPGMTAEGLKVEVLDDTVTLQVEVPAPETNADDAWLLRERRHGQFYRQLILPVGLDSARAEAEVKDGVLTLRLPKTEAARPKKIAVKARN